MAEASGGAAANAPPPIISDEALLSELDGLVQAQNAQSSLNSQLYDAAAMGDVAALREALAAGAHVDAKRTDHAGVSRTPLARVLHPMKTIPSERRTACVRALLLAGASPSAPITHGGNPYTALHDAAYLGLYTVCRLLLDAGADVNAPHNVVGDPNTPIHYAVNRSHQKVIALLLSRGAVDGPNVDRLVRSSYLQKVRAAGSFAAYEKQHRAKLVAMLAPKFAHVLPPELVSVVITFWAPVGLH